jgi:YD repeat-containing protein
VPAAHTPNGGADLFIGYFDTDAVGSLSQNGSTTSYTLDAAGRRQSATTTGTGAHTLVRHYTDSSDNPGWEDDTVTGTTRFVESLGGDLGLTVTATGEATLPLATLHGDVVTSSRSPAPAPRQPSPAGRTTTNTAPPATLQPLRPSPARPGTAGSAPNNAPAPTPVCS